ncbi:casein kinase 1-like protein HD16 isoform X2 [Morus notabilis]|uniref:casein kinase 1-like protein HD16 isoform X2 n=1 Tax=Morus notabilis TaxID=981085 RepID=UPI000CED24A8|nr:casein kinase 1-like protein HD16 isoform X2 [Morus notabilis]
MTQGNVVKTLHACVLALIGASATFLQLKQQSPFQTDYKTMVAFLIAVCIYVVTGLASTKFNGFAEEVTTKVSLLSGLLSPLLLFLIMVPALGWVCLVLWALLVVIIAYKKVSSRHLKPSQQDSQSQDHVAIQTSPDRQEMERLTMEEENNEEQPQKRISMGSPATKWISVFDPSDKVTKQRYHFNVEDSRLSPKIEKGKEDGLFISSVASCSNLWALIMDDGTGFSDQVYDVSPFFLHEEWIKKQWAKDFYITAIAGAEDGSSLVVMSKGTKSFYQIYKVNDSFPFKWIKEKWEQGYFVTAMATSGSRWAIVVSKGAGFSEQFVEVDSKYPSELIRERWKSGCFITAAAATVDQAAFVLSVPRLEPANHEQETYRTSGFPAKKIEENWERNYYVTSICYGRTDS